jgi:hypothetical protein
MLKYREGNQKVWIKSYKQDNKIAQNEILSTKLRKFRDVGTLLCQIQKNSFNLNVQKLGRKLKKKIRKGHLIKRCTKLRKFRDVGTLLCQIHKNHSNPNVQKLGRKPKNSEITSFKQINEIARN